MTPPDREPTEATEKPRALELYDEWETLGYDLDRPITPELEVEWLVMQRLYSERLAADRKLSSDLESIYGKVGFKGAFKYWGNGRPSLDWHIGTPGDPDPVARIDPREILVLELGVTCAKEAHEKFGDLELEPVPKFAWEHCRYWLDRVGRNSHGIEQLVRKEFSLGDWQPGFQYLEACVRNARDQIELASA